jgi:hypothetical protein
MEDIPWPSIPSCLDGQCILIEPPDLLVFVRIVIEILCALSIWFVDDQECIVFDIEVPVLW